MNKNVLLTIRIVSALSIIYGLVLAIRFTGQGKWENLLLSLVCIAAAVGSGQLKDWGRRLLILFLALNAGTMIGSAALLRTVVASERTWPAYWAIWLMVLLHLTGIYFLSRKTLGYFK
jgi:hypothetical protein